MWCRITNESDQFTDGFTEWQDWHRAAAVVWGSEDA